MPITINGDSGLSGVNGDAGTPALQGTDSNTGIVFGTDTVQISTGGSTRATVDSSGNVGIGTSSPSSYGGAVKLAVASSSNTSLTIASGTSSDGTILFADGTSGDATYRGQLKYSHSNDAMLFNTAATERMRLKSAGALHVFNSDIGIRSISGAAGGTSVTIFRGSHSGTGTDAVGTESIYIFSNGNVQNSNNSYGQISDVKLKENIVDANSQWNDIKGVQVRNFNFKEETGNPTHTQIGVVAQELETVSPGLVYETPDTDDDGNDLGTVTKSVNYSVLYMKAVKALQEAIAKIETLETQNASLEARLTALEGGAS